ncbi:M14 family zinc carboxypeptidase [Mucilaginibacter galii]|uniref:Peptidase M14 n=1 Tax=Mucilaginibacter galii TaxID=2005073 RepID=A0A917N390_9SPHI|nr:M14 family zinc carboxypeptidase [Mucilaginibacter galii]GGI52698.1 peptidase M14 [Mucilaginibacter galii]
MKLFHKIGASLIVIFIVTLQQVSAQNNYFFPKATALDSRIPTPEQFLGYPIGSYFTRIDQVNAYFRELARVSDRVHVQTIGKTYEQREQIIVTITSPSNYGRLEDIRKEHLNQIDPVKPVLGNNAPIIVHLGYGVHGNETSSTEVSLLTGYYLAASNDPETQKWLSESIIFIDPALNPDGRDRAANWHNAYHSFPPVGDPVDKEHVEGWPAGRTNHYFTDLNRDWLNLVQVESRNRIEFFHKWYPNVQIDFHEQGTNATYYFEPSPKRHESPIVPQFLYEYQAILAKYHAKALDDIGSFYFTKENYDNLSPIYGSTYPKFFGSVAATFEQASSRGIQQESSNGLVTFAFTIRNHLATSFSTIRGAVAEKAGLFKVQKDFFKYALDQGQKNPAKSYVFGDSKDVNLTQKFLGLLLQHRIKVYELNDNYTQDGKTFEKSKAYVVPSAQPNFLLVHSIFEENILQDSIYYDNTGWSIIHAYGLKYAKTPVVVAKAAEINSLSLAKGEVEGGKSSYAYLLNYSDYNASKALYKLLLKNVLVKTAFKSFTVTTGSGKHAYSSGSLVIPVAGQSISADSLYKAVQEVAANTHINVLAVNGGFSAEGIDLGSSNIKAIRKPEVALAFGQGVVASEAGQVWYLLNQQLDMPVTKIDLSSFARASLKRYNVLVLPAGNYSAWDNTVVEKLKSWVNDGGTLITFQTATAWAVQQGLVKEKLVEADFSSRGGRGDTPAPAPEQNVANAGAPAQTASSTRRNNVPAIVGAEDATAKKEKQTRLDYARQEDVEGSRRINGAIFQADLDITHPIAFGVTSRKLFINKNGPTILVPSTNKYTTIAQYNSKPFINGYSSKVNINRVANSAAIIAAANGNGEVVLFADDPTYRGYWLGTNRLFLNAIFFANLLNGGGGLGGE